MKKTLEILKKITRMFSLAFAITFLLGFIVGVFVLSDENEFLEDVKEGNTLATSD